MSSRPDIVNGVLDDAATASHKGISFDVVMDPPKKVGRAPRMRGRGKKELLTEATLTERLRLAEERRKKHIEDRLERIRLREEEALRLARAMDPLIISSQRKAGEGKEGGAKPPLVARSEAVQAGRKVVDMVGQIQKDLDCPQQNDLDCPRQNGRTNGDCSGEQ